ncbi:MAG: hypothetical protein LUE22_03075 [Oscillospiraceae bacterium]|nr:hypothetical protein [Oscillospiraceae bacterium]
MTIDETKAYLQRYREAGQQAARLEREIDRWKAQARRLTVSYGTAPPVTGDSVEAAAAHVDELTRELAAQVEALLALRQEIEASISAVEDARHRELLRRRYIDGQTWEQIAGAMHYSTRWVKRMHCSALQEAGKAEGAGAGACQAAMTRPHDEDQSQYTEEKRATASDTTRKRSSCFRT